MERRHRSLPNSILAEWRALCWSYMRPILLVYHLEMRKLNIYCNVSQENDNGKANNQHQPSSNAFTIDLPRVCSPMHGVNFCQVPSERSSGSQLYTTHRFQVRRCLDKSGITSSFSCILPRKTPINITYFDEKQQNQRLLTRYVYHKILLHHH